MPICIECLYDDFNYCFADLCSNMLCVLNLPDCNLTSCKKINLKKSSAQWQMQLLGLRDFKDLYGKQGFCFVFVLFGHLKTCARDNWM